MTISPSTPLSAIDAVVLDTETTGLDQRTARIVQVGAVRIIAGRLCEVDPLDVLVNPEVPIPPGSSDIHGITDAAVAAAPTFKDVAPQLGAYIDGAVVIGHTIGFDLGILAREHRSASLPFRMPHALDVRLLARLAAPELAQYDLDRLAAWLGVQIKGRHSARGDAIATAEVFIALVPLLRQKNIRTLAEAEAASKRLAEAEARAAGELPKGAEAEAPIRPRSQIDSFPYRHRISDVMSAPAIFAAAEATLADGVRLLLERKTSSTFVRLADGSVGIVTERDILRAIAAGPSALETQLGGIAKGPLQSVRDTDFVYRAIGRMERLGIRHLGVVDATGEVVGAVTTRNLLRHRSTSALVLGDDIEMAADQDALAAAWSKLAPMASQLVAEEVDARSVAAVISAELQHMTRRAAELAEAAMAAEGRGAPPVPYAVLVLGSGGRGESLLSADQDNAIVYAQGEDGSDIDRYFEELGKRLCATLDAAGIPYCNGGVMAQNRAWRMSLADWRKTVAGWLTRQRPQDLLSVDIFFDAVAVHGDLVLGESVREDALADAAHARDFLMALTEVARQKTPALTMFGRLRTDEKGRIDVKKGGLMPVFSSARVLAIRHGITARSTPDRLAGVAAKGIASPGDIEAVIEAHRTILDAMLAQQLRDIETGVPPSPRIEVGRLDRRRTAALKAALGQVDTAIALVSEGRM